jgi:hypothetical protein
VTDVRLGEALLVNEGIMAPAPARSPDPAARAIDAPATNPSRRPGLNHRPDGEEPPVSTTTE